MASTLIMKKRFLEKEACKMITSKLDNICLKLTCTPFPFESLLERLGLATMVIFSDAHILSFFDACAAKSDELSA